MINKHESSNQKFLLFTIVLSSVVIMFFAGLIIFAHQLSDGLARFRINDKYIEVKGLSERIVKSDLVTWQINLSDTSDSPTNLYKKITSSQQKIEDFLLEKGISTNEIQKQPFAVTDNYSYSGNINDSSKRYRYNAYAGILVSSDKVDLILKISAEIGQVVLNGVALSSSNISFLYTKLNEIKETMLIEATTNAKKTVATILKANVESNSKISNEANNEPKIIQLTQGLFTISSIDGNITNDTINLEKKVRVVINTRFLIN